MKRKFNYTGNVNCNMIKPIERKFFRYLIKQINYDKVEVLEYRFKAPLAKELYFYMEEFCNEYNCTKKLLEYYISKWSFFRQNTFNIPYLDDECYTYYNDSRYTIPSRVSRKLFHCLHEYQCKEIDNGH